MSGSPASKLFLKSGIRIEECIARNDLFKAHSKQLSEFCGQKALLHKIYGHISA